MTFYLIAGGTGFLGSHFIKSLQSTDSFRVLSRNAATAAQQFRNTDFPAQFEGAVQWDPVHEALPASSLNSVDTLVNFAGESVASGRWTRRKKQRIYDSRVLGTQHLVAALLNLDHQIETFLSTSAVGYYGFQGDYPLTETSVMGTDFLANVVQNWELPLQELAETKIRVLVPRMGVLLGAAGGAFPKMIRPFRFFVGGRIGTGKQWVPWIHIDDSVRALYFLLGASELSGVFNLVAPLPADNQQLTRAIAAQLGRPALFPMPGFLLKIILGGFAEVLLESQKAIPQRLTTAGFEFLHDTIEEAITDLLKP